MQNNDQILLRVEHLSQFFGPTKAVDDVSFDIKKGEVFGLVGESGCGKTTTGRSIIKLYNITGGNVFFKGIRIAAGKRTYKEAIAAAQETFKAESAAHPERAAELKAQMAVLIFLPAILIPACSSSSPAFHMMSSEYKLNKQGDNIQP